MSLIRLALVLGLIAYFVPLPTESDSEVETASISPFAAIGAAQSTFSDVSQFCERNPHVCDTGRDVATIMALKAKNGARMIADYLEEPADGEADAALSEVPALSAASDGSSAEFQPADGIPIPRPRPARG